jgi:hypothetical protein
MDSEKRTCVLVTVEVLSVGDSLRSNVLIKLICAIAMKVLILALTVLFMFVHGDRSGALAGAGRGRLCRSWLRLRSLAASGRAAQGSSDRVNRGSKKCPT